MIVQRAIFGVPIIVDHANNRTVLGYSKKSTTGPFLTIVVGTTVLLTSIALGTPYAYAQSHYQIGYNDGCAGNVVPGPHTSDYKRGYADGQSACSGGGSGGGGDSNIPQPLSNNPRFPSSSDWTLTVNINNVNFGESSIGVNIKGPFGYTDYQSVRNGPSPTATFTIPDNAVPVGYN